MANQMSKSEIIDTLKEAEAAIGNNDFIWFGECVSNLFQGCTIEQFETVADTLKELQIAYKRVIE